MKFEWFCAYVESLLGQLWGSPARADDDGDWPFRQGTAACRVAVRPEPRWRVEVFGHAAFEVKQSARLLRELNEANAHLLDGRIYWREDVVLVATSIEADRVDGEALARACMGVGSTADDLGALLAAMFDGRTPFPAELGA